MAGRVGDSPLLGAGAFADDAMGAASTTGHGESIMKTLLAFRVLQAASSLSLSSESRSLSLLEERGESGQRKDRARHD